MSYFAAVVARTNDRWHAVEVSVDDCESLADLGDVARDVPGEVRLLVLEQDDEYAALVRVDDDDDEARGFLSDGHAADAYPMAALLVEDLTEIAEIGADEIDDDNILSDAPPTHESMPFGDAEIAEDLGTSAADLLSMCEHLGTLPIDVLVAVCEKAGCGQAFEDVRA
ncbi:MAG: tRNA adenosine deaminase-associated protein [Pseudonocardiales bacterium]|nr:tRNA adenosine deaminase-associated protein [Actinomycetota bacterium]